MTRRPVPPIEFAGPDDGIGERITGPAVAVDASLAARLAAVCPTTTAAHERAEAGRDWWPLALHWALDGMTARLPGAVCSPRTTEEVAAVVAIARAAGVPVTPAGGRSGVCGATVPLAGGIALDLTALCGVTDLDIVSGVVEVLPGTFGPDLEAAIAPHGLSVGHFPQSFDIATVGGWVACRGAGQFSTRYGKVEDMVVGLEVVLADGTVVRTGGAPAAAVGPDLTQVFVGSEGTLGVITRVWLRAHRIAPASAMASFGFAAFADGIDACRRILQRGATPAVLRLYDAAESARGQGGDGTTCVLLVYDEADPVLLEATMRIVAEECAAATALGPDRVERWMQHRNDTSALQALTRKGYVVDTLEVTGAWRDLPRLYDATCDALRAVPGCRAATSHLSHSYPDGACLYFTFAAAPGTGQTWTIDEIDRVYTALWDAGQRAALAHGGNLAHHHGVGLNRHRFVREALGAGTDVLAAIKRALDPTGLFNPGKLGLPNPFTAASRDPAPPDAAPPDPASPQGAIWP